MTAQLLVFAALLYQGAPPTHHKQAPKPRLQYQRLPVRRPYTVAVTTAEAFARLQAQPEPPVLVADKQGFIRIGDTFVLRLTNGRRVQLRSKPGAKYEENVAELSYLGKLTSLRKYVLHVQYWESSAVLLVDQATGVVDTLQDVPVPSPGASRIAVAFQGFPYEGAPNGVDVYQVALPHVRRRFSIVQQQWVPYGLAWADERSFIVRCLPVAIAEGIDSTTAEKQLLQSRKKLLYLRVTIR